MAAGHIVGGTIYFADGAMFNLVGTRGADFGSQPGTLENVTLNGNQTIGNQQSVNVKGTLILNGTITEASGGGGNDRQWMNFSWSS